MTPMHSSMITRPFCLQFAPPNKWSSSCFQPPQILMNTAWKNVMYLFFILFFCFFKCIFILLSLLV